MVDFNPDGRDSDRGHGRQEAGHAGRDPDGQGYQSGAVEAGGVPVGAFLDIQAGQVEPRPAEEEIVGDEDAADRAEQRGIGDEPGVNIAGGVREQLPGLDQNANDARNQAAGAERNSPRPEVGEVVRRADHVGRQVRGQRRQAQGEQGHDQDHGVGELCHQHHRVPDFLAVNDDRRRRDGHAAEGVQPHGRRQPDSLADDLVALRIGVAAEVRNVERQGRPEPDHRRQGGEEELPKLPGPRPSRRELRGLRENRTKAAGCLVGPRQQGEAHEDEQQGLDVQQEADRLDAPVDDRHVDGPEEEEARELGHVDAEGPNRGQVSPTGQVKGEDLV